MNKARHISIFCLGFLIVSCTTTKDVYLPDGRQGHVIDCSGGSSWGDCYEKAGKLCATEGYTVVSQNSEAKTIASAYNGTFTMGTAQSRILLIACGK